MQLSQSELGKNKKHPWLILTASCLVNLLILALFATIGADHARLEDNFLNSNLGACLYFLGYLLIYSIFVFALYLTGWRSDSRRKRFIFVLFGGLLLFISWGIAILVIVLFGIGYLANLYS
jgi:hypothetical protein